MADGLQAEWRPVRIDQPLSTGERLLRATSVDGTQAFVRTEIHRDAVTEIAPRYIPPEEIPADHATVADPATGQVVAMARYEVTRRAWGGWLSSMADPQFATEMAPLQWDGGEQRLDVAVRGLSFYQARAFAAAHGAHLPTAREQWLAASAGLRQLEYPWGGAQDSARVAADRFRMSDAESVFSRRRGESPLGVVHVMGNVSEILSAFGSEPAVGGGCFLDDQERLRLDGAARVVLPIEPLAGLRTGNAGAGLRLYRFVAALDDPDANTCAIERREQLRQSTAGCILTDWTLRRDGSLRYMLELRGRYDGGDLRRRLNVSTPGFLQSPRTVVALDGHWRPLSTRARIKVGAESSDLETTLDASLRTGQGYCFFVTAT